MGESSISLIRQCSGTDQWLVTTAIGGNYFAEWEQWARPFWEHYAERHGYGIAVVTGDINHDQEQVLDGSWQKLLAPRALRMMLGRDVRCAMWDTDLIPSPVAPAIFSVVPDGRVGVVSMERNLPFGDPGSLRKRIAFLRGRCMSADFPLWSALNATPEQRFEWAGLPSNRDFFCAGMFVVDTAAHADLLADWYRQAPTTEEYASFGSEQLWLNAKAQEAQLCEWLPYEWQALWMFEVAALYPFLYAESVSAELAQWCFAASLMRNHIVHLAGRWETSLLDNGGPVFPNVDDLCRLLEELADHEMTPQSATPLGKIYPSNLLDQHQD